MAKPTRKLVPRDDRITINHEFTSVDEFIAEYVSNISRSGVFIRTKSAPLAVGTKVNLRFTVIMDELETIEGIGEVVRVQDSPRGMGVVFVTLTSHSQNLIGKLITARRKGRDRGVPPPPPAAAMRRGRETTGETVTRQVLLEPESDEPVVVRKAPPPPPKRGKS
jgi:PilZ domain